MPSTLAYGRSLSIALAAALSACGGGNVSTTSTEPSALGDASQAGFETALNSKRTIGADGTPSSTEDDVRMRQEIAETEETKAAGDSFLSGTVPAPDSGKTATTAVLPPDLATPPDLVNGTFIDTRRIPAGFAGYPDDRLKSTTEVAPASDIGAFRTTCAFSHMSFDDPIVFPGQSGKSHLHAFFGNTSTNADSTPESIRTTGNSTCRGGTVNRSAYWVPAMIDVATGTPLTPDGLNVYYKCGYEIPCEKQVPMPVGLRMIAGDPTATPEKPDTHHRFKCIGGPNNENDKYGSTIPDCDIGAQVWQEIFFPQCWDGVNLDSPDHKSHMSYVVQDQQPPFAKHCPATHPVALPEISFNVMYTVTGARWRLSSDLYSGGPGGHSSHGDWFNGWKKEISDTWARSCDMARKDCHSHLLGDGRQIF